MDQQLDQIELIERAQCGDRQCLELLAGQAKKRLYTYVYRMTQQEELAQEIVQESLFEMCKVLGKLKKADRFWPWLHGIATNKLRRHYRTERTQRNLAAVSMERKESMKERQDGLERLVGDELKHIVWSAMQKLKTRYKAVLVMRCYDGMAYSDIAEAMGCTEFSTRMLFLRAKRSLQKELSRNGFSKGTLLAALMIFGKMTAPSKAAAAQISISSAAMKVGVVAGVAGLATTKTAIISLTAAGALTAGVVTTSNSWHKPDNPNAALTGAQVAAQNNNEEYWYYFPQGPSGPLMLRGNAKTPGGNTSWQVLQNDHDNYYYSDGRVEMNNHRMWKDDLSVMTVPTDDAGMVDFICQIEGRTNNVERVNASGRGLMVVAERSKTDEATKPWAIRHYNVLDEDYFQSDWPGSAKLVDNRDEMHERGWTYFRVSGQINGRGVYGTGRIPFVYSRSARYSPWLKLQIGNLTVADTGRDAYIQSSASDQIQTYRAGSFFSGFPRPWAGFHTIDTIRRDAAQQRIPFETRHTPGSDVAEVELNVQEMRVVYKIELETDVINEITFFTDHGQVGNLKFSYLQSIDGVSGEFVSPVGPRQRTDQQDSSGVLWLIELAKGSLG
ncbi:MAG: sigma-70 family RNA polymerase sigma factor [Sedimentisphaerales bacterium]|nr:sigma-70 family RNA polymerase sigma factor [Sedimentisphaerales bacterium]